MPKRGRYFKYLTDTSLPVPSSTQHDRRKKIKHVSSTTDQVSQTIQNENPAFVFEQNDVDEQNTVTVQSRQDIQADHIEDGEINELQDIINSDTDKVELCNHDTITCGNCAMAGKYKG